MKTNKSKSGFKNQRRKKKTGLLKKAGVLLMAAAVTVGSVWCVGKRAVQQKMI